MTTPHTPAVELAELAAIEARAAAATAGPWAVYATERPLNELGRAQFPNGCAPLIERRIGTSWDHGQLRGPMPVVTTSSGPFNDPRTSVEISEADAEFIAHAREDVPALLAALRSLTAHVASEPERVAAAVAAATAAERGRCEAVCRARADVSSRVADRLEHEGFSSGDFGVMVTRRTAKAAIECADAIAATGGR